MTPMDPATCAWCPRLCRHVCPVAVATGREAVLPSAMFTAAVLWRDGQAVDLREALDLCLGCGACEAHCKHHVPVPGRVAELRAEAGAVRVADSLGPIEGDATVVCVLAGQQDWSAAWARAQGVPAARLWTKDELGFAAWAAGTSDAHLHSLGAAFRGRRAVTASVFAAAVLRAAGVEVELLPVERALPRVTTCLEEPAGGCCGRREGFDERHPALAGEVARERARALGGEPHACADEGCARWLRTHGAQVVAPTDRYAEG